MLSNLNTEHIAGSSLPDNSLPDNTELSALAEETLRAFETAYLVVQIETGKVLWASSGAEALLPALNKAGSSGLREMYPDLARLFDNTSDSIDEYFNLPVSVMIDGKPRQCQRALLKNNLIGLMISADTDTLGQLSKYMADREQLFTTSRTISVSEMATSLAHEINQPVGSIANILKGLKSRLKRTDSVPDEYVTVIDRALEQTSFAARIVARIRDFTSSRQPKRVDCEVQNLLQDSIKLLDWVLMNASVDVELVPADSKIWVNADVTMLQQVFTNLIRNAVDSMRESSGTTRHLKICAFRQSDEVQIEISDNGHGLSDSARENIFVPFVTQKTQGMGVGLNICRSFVELHQGKLWLMPNDDGGCTASVLLPVVDLTCEKTHQEESTDACYE